MPKTLTFITHNLIGLLLLLMPIWWKLPEAPAPFTSTYVLGFGVTWLILALSGMSLLRAFIMRPPISRIFIFWVLLWLLFLVWTWASQTWAFMGVQRPAIGYNATLHTAIIGLFGISVYLARPPIRLVVRAILLGLGIHGVIGGLQIVQQGGLGLPFEFDLNPAISGVSVVEADGVRWLRPYGLLPHPNIWAGFILGGMLTALWLWGRGGRLGLTIYGSSFWLLLLSFSRGAWVAFAVTGIILLPIWLKYYGWRSLRLPALVTVALGIGFSVLYMPFLFARTGIGQENTEMRSIADRIVYAQIAQDAIIEHPFLGVGGGNFAWYASDYLRKRTPYDLRGDNVHVVGLGVASELGVVGFLLWLGLVGLPLGRGLILAWWGHLDAMLYVGIGIAWMVIGLFDHYPWTLIFTQGYWVFMLAGALGEEVKNQQVGTMPHP